MNTGSIIEGETMKDGELDKSHKLLQCVINMVFTFKRKECWSHGNMCGRVSKHRPQKKRAAEYYNRNRNICRVTCIRTLMQEDMDG